MPGSFEKSIFLESIDNAEERTKQFAFPIKSFIFFHLNWLSLFYSKGLPPLCLHMSGYQDLPDEPSTFSWL